MKDRGKVHIYYYVVMEDNVFELIGLDLVKMSIVLLIYRMNHIAVQGKRRYTPLIGVACSCGTSTCTHEVVGMRRGN